MTKKTIKRLIDVGLIFLPHTIAQNIQLDDKKIHKQHLKNPGLCFASYRGLTLYGLIILSADTSLCEKTKQSLTESYLISNYCNTIRRF
jgi:hypothetical protein